MNFSCPLVTLQVIFDTSNGPTQATADECLSFLLDEKRILQVGGVEEMEGKLV